ncbi:hypothetical protein I7I48_05068 [Histoplasma ohiense]|nr:hypothetical protein I7I48_05068 [Histoplasma ohiense (nom. inval.)]
MNNITKEHMLYIYIYVTKGISDVAGNHERKKKNHGEPLLRAVIRCNCRGGTEPVFFLAVETLWLTFEIWFWFYFCILKEAHNGLNADISLSIIEQSYVWLGICK